MELQNANKNLITGAYRDEYAALKRAKTGIDKAVFIKNTWLKIKNNRGEKSANEFYTNVTFYNTIRNVSLISGEKAEAMDKKWKKQGYTPKIDEDVMSELIQKANDVIKPLASPVKN